LFLDINNNETETPNTATDRRWSDKSRLPVYQGSFGFNIDYKGFYLESQFNYILGAHRQDFDLSILENTASIGDFRHSTTVLDFWTPTNTDATFPRLNASNLNTFNGTSDRYLVSTNSNEFSENL
jgi:hypothetical protein